MTTFYAFIILLGVLVTIHEFGHFIAARSVGIRVERFSVGVPPRLFSITSINEGFLLNIFLLIENTLVLPKGLLEVTMEYRL